MKTTLNQSSWELMKADAETTYPHECCGFFFGTENGELRDITQVTIVDNTRENNRERRFEISAKDYMKAERHAAENGLALLGVYHSHPDHPAIPSEYDRTHAMPYFSYVIISVEKGNTTKVTSWRLNDQKQFDREELFIESKQIHHSLTQ